MSGTSEEHVALLNKLDATSFTSEADKDRAREAAWALLARLESPLQTISRMANKYDEKSFSNEADRVSLREATRTLHAKLETPRDVLMRMIWAEVGMESALS